MGYTKDRMIEEMQDEREDLILTSEGIERSGENYECPNERCESKVCTRSCFARQCFDWCVVHEHPSVEEKDGEVSVTVGITEEDALGQLVERKVVEQRRVCGHEDAKKYPGDCRIITSSGYGGEMEAIFWELDEEERMSRVMERDTP